MLKKAASLLIGAAALGGSALLLRRSRAMNINPLKPKHGCIETGMLSPTGKQVPPPKPESSVRDRKPAENKMTGSVTFFAGIQNPREMDLSIRYDAFRYEWQLVDDEFRVPTSATHVGFIFGEDVSLQLEVPDILRANGFEGHKEYIANLYGAVTPVSYGVWSGITYVDGDILCAALQIPEAEDYYLLVSIIKEHKSEDDFRELGSNVDVVEMISSIQLDFH